jgi:hypothetical protein
LPCWPTGPARVDLSASDTDEAGPRGRLAAIGGGGRLQLAQRLPRALSSAAPLPADFSITALVRGRAESAGRLGTWMVQAMRDSAHRPGAETHVASQPPPQAAEAAIAPPFAVRASGGQSAHGRGTHAAKVRYSLSWGVLAQFQVQGGRCFPLPRKGALSSLLSSLI